MPVAPAAGPRRRRAATWRQQPQRRCFGRSTRGLLWEASSPGERSVLPSGGAAFSSASVRADAEALRPVRTADRGEATRRLLQQREFQTLLADALSPYDPVDPVLLSTLLTDKMDGFLSRVSVDRDTFIADFDRARGREGTAKDRRKFRRKYGFNPLAVVYREEEFAISDRELDSLQVQLMEFNPENSQMESNYRWWESQLRDMFSAGYHYTDYGELKKWYEKDVKNRLAVVQYTHNVCSLIYRLCVYSRRIDGARAEKLLSPRYLPSWDEVMTTFHLDLPEPSAWAPVQMTDAVRLVRRADDYNRDEEGIYHNMSYPTFFSHFLDFHQSFHPFKHHCKVTGTFMCPTREMIEALSEYLVQRSKAYEATDVPILEVGAGTGRLAWLLNESPAFQAAGLTCIATDIKPQTNPFTLAYPRAMRDSFRSFPIERIDQQEACDKYKPAIVLCQMMPNAVDWPQGWRQTPCVLEYMLIGPADGPLCGRPWDTWGVAWGETTKIRLTQPFFRDGFRKVYVDAVSRYLINHDDHPQCNSLSRAVSFRRMGRLEYNMRFWFWHVGQVFFFAAGMFALAWYTNPLVDRRDVEPGSLPAK